MTSESPRLVSVVIPAFNHARYLPDAIRSVQAQTYPQIEVVVVDDGSTDATPAVVAQFPNVVYIRQRNQGPSAARNNGFRSSSGEYVVFLDADDRLTRDAIGIGVGELEGRPDCAFAAGAYVLTGPNGEVLHRPEREVLRTGYYRTFLMGNFIGSLASVVHRRAPLATIGGFDTSLPACEDYDVYLRMSRRWPVTCHGAVVAEYRQHGANLSADNGLMLASSVRLLRRELRRVRGNEELERAAEQGIGYYQEYYGKRLLKRLSDLEEQRAWRPMARGLSVLFWYHRNLFRYYVSLRGKSALRRVLRLL